MLMSSLYNMLLLTSLLSYGLLNLPQYLWSCESTKDTLFHLLETAAEVKAEYRGALVEFYLIVSQCKNMIAKKKTAENARYLEELEKEIPQKDLEG